MIKFTANQLFLKRATQRHNDMIRSLKYPQSPHYLHRVKDEIIRIELAIVDIKSRMNDSEISECISLT